MVYAFGSKKSRGIRSNVRVDSLRRNLMGMVQNQSESFLRPEAAKDIINMHAVEEGAWSADNIGYDLINASETAFESGANLDGMTWFTDTTFVDHLIVAINGKVGEVDPSLGTLTIKDASAGFTAGKSVDFELLNGVLYSADGTITIPRKWDGTTAGDAGGWPVSDGANEYSKPKYLASHQNRLVALNFQSGTGGPWPSHGAVSQAGNPEGFSLELGAASAFIFECQPGDGQQIVGAASIFVPRTNQQQLVIFKNKSTYVMVGNSGSPSDADRFQIIRINGSYGALNNKCIVNVGNDILALDTYGVTSYSSLSSSGDIQPTAIGSDLVKDVIASLNHEALDKCWGIHLPYRREVIWFLPTGAASHCNSAIVYKYPSPGTQELPKWSRRTSVGLSTFNIASGILAEDVFYIGTTDGFVGTMFTSSTYNGISVPYTYEYPYMSLGNEEQIKRILHGSAHFKLRSTLGASLKTQWQGGGNNDSTICPLSLETTVAGALYGTGVYGTDYYGQSDEVKIPFEPSGDGNRLKLTLEGFTSDSGPEFLGVTIVKESGGLVRHWN